MGTTPIYIRKNSQQTVRWDLGDHGLQVQVGPVGFLDGDRAMIGRVSKRTSGHGRRSAIIGLGEHTGPLEKKVNDNPGRGVNETETLKNTEANGT